MTAADVRAHGELDPHGRVWCAEHQRWECSKTSKRSQSRCHDLAIRGRDACKTHIGENTEVAKARGEANLLAWSTAAAADQALPPLDPGQTVMDQLRVAVLRADLLGERLRLQVEGDGEGGEGAGGLVGATWAAGRDGGGIQSGEQVRGLAKLEAEWRDRAVRFAKAAHDMGIAERHVELEQAKAAQVVGAVRVMLDELGLVPAERDRALRAFLGALGRGPETVAGEVTA